MPGERQLPLFAPPALDVSADAALAARRPPWVRLGTASWTFPGWAGVIYPGTPSLDELVDRGLEQYARHPLLNTVAITRSYYQALSPDVLQRYAAQLPADYRCVTKVWNAVTSLAEARTRQRNPHFFDAGFFLDAVLAPAEGSFSAHQGPFLFQLPPIHASELPSPSAFATTLDRFFTRLPPRWPYAVEVRNEGLLSPSYFEVLRHHRVSHTFSQWDRLPSIRAQLKLAGEIGARHVLCRAVMPMGMSHEQAFEAFTPFDRLQAVDEGMRADVLALATRCRDEGRTLWIIVDNKAEGCSPLTIRAITQRLVDAFASR